jgi:hypothetical protein
MSKKRNRKTNADSGGQQGRRCPANNHRADTIPFNPFSFTHFHDPFEFLSPFGFTTTTPTRAERMA